MYCQIEFKKIMNGIRTSRPKKIIIVICQNDTNKTKNFLAKFVSMDESQVYNHGINAKKQSKEWTSRGSLSSKKCKLHPLAGSCY